MAPAIRFAEEGFPVSERLAGLLRSPKSGLQQFAMSRRIFLKNGDYYQPGEILKQPELGATLRRIANNGAVEFYRGRTAHALAGEIKRKAG
jgi:gamma-glutamyltranspeptidase/glutathione hydrolase